MRRGTGTWWTGFVFVVVLGVAAAAFAGPAGDESATSAPAKASETKGPSARDCALLDDPQIRSLMDGRLLQLLIACGRADELGTVRSEPAIDTGIEAGSDVAVSDPSGDSGISHTQSETSQAINEVTGTICAGYNDSYHGVVTGQGYSGYSRSTDGGASFTDQGALTAGNYGDPALVWRKADGHFYFATLGDSGLRLYKSSDDCVSFQLVGNINNGLSDDKELMAVDNDPASPYYGRLYVVWTNFSVDARIWERHSSDGGATWSAGHAISASSNVQGAWPAVATDGTGTAYAAWAEFGGTMAIRVSKSTDGGTSWTAVTAPASGKTRPADAAATSNCGREALRGNIRYLPSPQIAVGPGGALHAIYSYDPDGGGADTVDVFYRRSTDGGATWETEVRVNDDATTTDQFFPTLAVSASNVVSAAWYDRRNDTATNTMVDYYQAFSFDGGVTWEPNERISDVSSPIYLDGNLAGCYHGDYDTQVMSESFAHLQWSDDRRLQGGHNDPDVFADTQAISSDFLVLATPGAGAVCAPDDAVFTIDVPQFLGFNQSVSLAASGVPAGGVATFVPQSLTPPGSSTLTISNTAAIAAGTSVITVTGTSPPSIVHEDDVSLTVFTQIAGTAALTSPADGSFNQDLRPTFEWTAAVQAASYVIEIATDEAFTNIVVSESDVVGTTFTPAADLASNTQHFWRVRAVNACGASADSAVFDFYTQALAGDCGFGTAPVIAFEDDLEAGAVGWTHSAAVGSDTWALSGAQVHSGTAAFHADDVDSVSDQRLMTPAVVLPTNAAGLTLQFWNHQELEDSGGGCYDGGIVEISTDGGSVWTQLVPDPTTDPYDGQVSSSFSNPLANLDAWCGDPQDWTRTVVDLSAYAGQTAQLRFRLGTDSSVSHPGWEIDDVKIQTCEVVTTVILEDGFETNDTSAWSTTFP